MDLEPLADILLGHQAHDSISLLLRSIAIQSHDVTTDTPHVVPRRVKQLPPTIRGLRRERDIQMP